MTERVPIRIGRETFLDDSTAARSHADECGARLRRSLAHMDWWELFVVVVGGGCILWQLIVSIDSDATAWHWLSCVVACTAVLVRRRLPFTALTGALAAAAVASWIDGPVLPLWVASQAVLFSVTLALGRAASILPAIGVAVVLYLNSVLVQHTGVGDVAALGVVSWTLAVWGMATGVNSHRAAAIAWRDHADRLEQSRDEEIRRTVVEERLRIARDLHDELAHQIAVITVSAGAADMVLERDAVAARRSLRRVRDASRTALAEVQEIVGLLRTTDVPGESRGRTDLMCLVDAARETGLVLNADDLHVPALTAECSVAAYRALQECVTNARRHGSGSLRVSGTVSGSWWMLSARNHASSIATGSVVGFGLVGMRERIERVGGTVDVNASADEFVVSIRLPLATECDA